MIKKLDAKSIQNICANQVILDISACVKELLENSLDAESKTIEIYLKDFGQESIIVKDNGHGICKINFSTIIQKGATSKLSTFDDLNVINSYGFRGEALNALNQISDLTIITRTKDDIYGSKIKFNKENELIFQEDIASEIGTTIILEKIYQNFPVRLLDLKNNIKSHYAKILALITEYSLISLKTKIMLFNETKEKPKEMILNNGNPEESLSNRILKILGKKILDAVMEFECNLTETFQIKGFLMKNINSGSGKENLWLKKNMVYFYLNKRPIDPPKRFLYVLGEIYRQYNSNSKFIAILNFELKNEDVDYNLSPDKREIYLQNEKNLVQLFKNQINSFHEKLHSFQKSIPELPSKQKIQAMKLNAQETSIIDAMDDNIEKKKKINENTYSLIEKLSNNASPMELITNEFADHEENLERDNKKKYAITYFQPSKNNDEAKNELFEGWGDKINEKTQNGGYRMKIYEPGKKDSLKKNDNINMTEQDISFSQTQKIINLDSPMEIEITAPPNKKSFQMKIFEPKKKQTMDMSQKKENNYTMKIFEPKGTTLSNDVKTSVINFKPEQSESFTNEKIKFFNSKNDEMPKIIEKEAADTLENQNGLAFCKENFRNLKIIGQFNVGFIITYLKERDAIFIVDQHAADEKANFEKLIKEYKFESQMLINPLNLSNLTDIELHTIKENLSIFEKNGFSLIFKNDKEENNQKILLKSLPCFKNVQFNLDDFYELLKNINQLDHYSNDEIIRPCKFKSSIAYKACRSSLMVGDCLNKKEMKKVVDKLSELVSPWNCPHGRPTMIKSENLSNIMTKIKVLRPEIKVIFPNKKGI